MFGRTGERPTIALSMIVRNESAVIRRCLRSVKPLITSWAICDTGSTDGTQGIIREELAGLPGQLLERPWVGFAPNRNEALEAARATGADYLLVIDADEEFTADAGFTLEGLIADTYSAMFRIADTNARWPRKLLIKASLSVGYVGLMDEYLDDQGLDNRLIENCLVVSYPEGFRSRDGLKAKFERDVLVLQAELARDPNNSRNWFYLGQRLCGAERLEEGIAAYRKRLEFPGAHAERFQSAFQIAQYRDQLGHPWQEVATDYLTAVNEGPDRAEPLFQLGALYASHEQWASAELFMRAAARMPRPVDSQIVQDDIYAWLANDTLAGILAQRGKLREARELLTKLVALPQCPEDQRQRIAENITLIRQTEGEVVEATGPTLGPDENTYAQQAATVRQHGLRGLRDLARQFISRPSLQAMPSPARWLWLLVAGRDPNASAVMAFLCVVLLPFAVPTVRQAPWWLAAFSPLLWICGRRRLQDTTVAALTLAGIAAAQNGEPLRLAAAIFLLLACKEAAVFVLPTLAVAWLTAGHDLAHLSGALAIGTVGAALALFAIFGRMTLPLLRTAAAGHGTPYTLQFQKGAPHRLLVDIALVSPVATPLAIFGATHAPTLALTIATLVAGHALAPIRNVRLVLAAELLIRALGLITIAYCSKPIAALLMCAWIATDVMVWWRLRKVYDPTTEALAGELGMTRLAST